VDRILRTIVVTILMATLLAGRCLPCRDLYAKASTKSCCDKSGACTKIPDKNSKSKPCPLQLNVVASEKVDPQVVKVQLVAETQLALLPALLQAPLQASFIHDSAQYPQYSPPLLYLLNQQFLI
jgi:hypothetical protein